MCRRFSCHVRQSASRFGSLSSDPEITVNEQLHIAGFPTQPSELKHGHAGSMSARALFHSHVPTYPCSAVAVQLALGDRVHDSQTCRSTSDVYECRTDSGQQCA